jgi:S1-C subfamily serine protease
MGADFEKVSKVERDLLKIPGGIKITEVRNGFIRRLGIEEGFIITAVNRQTVREPEELVEILESLTGKVVIEGVNSKGIKGFYSYYF